MVIQTFYPIIGGSEKQCLAISKALKERGAEVKVFTERWVPFPAYEEIEGIPVKRLGRGGPRFFHSLFFMWSICFYLLVRAKTYDIIHVHLAASHAVASAMMGKFLNKKVIVKIGGGTLVGEIVTSRQTAFGKLKLWALGLLKPHFVILNEDQRKDLVGYGLERAQITQIANGVNTDVYFPPMLEQKAAFRAKLGWKGLIFLFAGRFSPDKIKVSVFENFLKSWANVKQTKDISFYLVGHGPLEQDYREVIHRLNLQDSVHLLKARENIAELYQAADVFVLPSSAEGLSNALLEAMACGLPVLASRVPGIIDIVSENIHGYLFDPSSSKEITDRLKTIVEEQKAFSEMGKNSRETAIKYSIGKAAEQYLALYS